MWLRLFDRLQRFLRRNAGSLDTELNRVSRSRSGGHRKRAGPFRRVAPTFPSASARPWGAAQQPWVTQPPDGPRQPPAMQPPAGIQPGAPGGAVSAAAAGGAGGGGAGRARIREAPYGAAPVASAETAPLAQGAAAGQQASSESRRAAPRQPWYQVIGPSQSGQPQGYPPALGHEMTLPAIANPTALADGHEAGARANPAARDRGQARLPFTPPHPEGVPAPSAGDGRANCGPLEKILWRQWEEGTTPHPQAVVAVERLASFPRALQEKLADGLTSIYVGSGGVPELDHMTRLRGVPLPSGKATWDACAGAYGERKIVVGTQPSPTPDVVCHEVGHALDDLDSPPGRWQSDSAEFRLIYDQCRPYLASEFHGQRGGLGRKEFFADSFAAIASRQRPALVDMLSGDTRLALRVMLYFNRRYGI